MGSPMGSPIGSPCLPLSACQPLGFPALCPSTLNPHRIIQVLGDLFAPLHHLALPRVAAPPRQHLLLRPILLLLFRLLLRVLAEAKERTRGRGRSAPRPPARRGGGGWWEGRRGAGSGAAGAAALRARSAEEAANRAAAPGEPLTLLPPPGVRWRSSASAVALAWLPLLQTGSEIQDLGASSPSRPAHLAQNGLDGLQAAFRAIGCECCCPGRF